MTEIAKRVYGWRPDKPDQRDWKYGAPKKVAISLPPRVDLRPEMPVVYDQGDLGSCTGNAIAAAYEYITRKEEEPDFMPSRLFIYWNERFIEDTVGEDAGAEIRDGIKVMAKIGACREIPTWPYSSPFTKKPPPKAFKEAAKHKVTSYRRVDQTLTELRSALAQNLPIVFGFMVYESFITLKVSKSGRVVMPNNSEKALGGHAVLCVGYDHPKRVFICRNSWGSEWGMAGYFTLPYAYVTDQDLSADFWVIAANS